MRTVYLNASYFPAVELLSAIGTAAILLYGGYQGDLDGDDRRSASCRVRRLPADVLRPDPADLPALHDLPAGHGGAGQDLRPARHRARHCRPRRTRSTRADPRRDRARGRLVLLREDDRRAATGRPARRRGRRLGAADVDLHVPPARRVALVGETGAGKSTLAKLVARFYDPQRGRVLVDGHDVRDLRLAAPAQPARDRAPGGLPVLGTIGENIASAGRTRARRRSRRRPRAVGGGRRSSAAARRASTTEVGERGVAAVGRPAAARRVRAGAAGRAADPDPRRGDLERRRPDRAADRARARAPARRPHRDRDRAPPLDDPQRRPDRRARERADRRERAPTTS